MSLNGHTLCSIIVDVVQTLTSCDDFTSVCVGHEAVPPAEVNERHSLILAYKYAIIAAVERKTRGSSRNVARKFVLPQMNGSWLVRSKPSRLESTSLYRRSSYEPILHVTTRRHCFNLTTSVTLR